MDNILNSWLLKQEDALREFATQTDVVTVTRCEATPCRSYMAEYRCRGLVRTPSGDVVEADRFLVGIHFGESHLRKVDPLHLVWLLTPDTMWHPNAHPPAICVGHVFPGISLTDIIYQTYSIITYQNMSIGDHLNPEAAAWAREHLDMFPIDRRPLKRRDTQISVQEVN